jgi:hypothetical protein
LFSSASNFLSINGVNGSSMALCLRDSNILNSLIESDLDCRARSQK